MELLPATSQVEVRLARRLRRETTMSLKWLVVPVPEGVKYKTTVDEN